MSDEVIVNRLIIPPEEAEKLVSQAGDVYLRDCPCREEMQLCPPEEWNVCLLFKHASDKDRRQAKRISTDEAVQIVRATTERGDIHQVFYFQDGERLFELCNCCTCCCFPLREAKDKDDDFKGQLQTGYIATTDAELCTGCGLCIDSCFFEARRLENENENENEDEDGALHLIDALCFGCARCIPTCPEGAIRLEHHPGRGIPIPGFQ